MILKLIVLTQTYKARNEISPYLFHLSPVIHIINFDHLFYCLYLKHWFFFSLLPAPSAPVWDRDEERAREKASKPSTALASATRSAPPYGQRKSWIPR